MEGKEMVTKKKHDLSIFYIQIIIKFKRETINKYFFRVFSTQKILLFFRIFLFFCAGKIFDFLSERIKIKLQTN
jgi:hypothetical protein